MNTFELLSLLLPDFDQDFTSRLSVLAKLDHYQKRVGRKLLAEKTGISERSLRTLLDSFREAGLVTINRSGILLTELGRQVFQEAEFIHPTFDRLGQMERSLCQQLGLERCWIVAGDAEKDPSLFTRMGECLEGVLDQFLPHDKSVITVTGGSTLANVGQYLSPRLTKAREVYFVPSRGGVEGSIHIQSNTVAGLMAQVSEGHFVPFYVPDHLTNADASQALLQEPSVSKAIQLSKEADCLILSIGSADVMAQRRDLSSEERQALKDNGAVGEAFGTFYDQEGQAVFSLQRAGLQLEEITRFPLLLIVVGGRSKALATQSFFKMVHQQGWLICDEGLAKKVLNGEYPIK